MSLCAGRAKLQENMQCKAQTIYWFRRHATMINHQQYNVTDVQIWTDTQDSRLSEHALSREPSNSPHTTASSDRFCLDYGETCY